MCPPLQNTHTDSHKKSSVRHKLVSLTLKKKSKITEEVSDGVAMAMVLHHFSLLVWPVLTPVFSFASGDQASE